MKYSNVLTARPLPRPTALVTALSAVFAVAAASAQTAAPAPVLPRPEAPVTTPAPARPLDLQTPARPALTAPPGVSVRVERFVVSGATLLSQADLDATLAPFTGRTLGYAQLQDAANALTDTYRRRGYLLALAYLPQQRIADGVVELAVLEGRLGALSVNAAPGLDASFAQQVAQWRLAGGEIVSEANLVRNLIVLNELPGFAVAAAVRPGSQVGTADVVVDARNAGGDNPARWAGAAVFDNHGTPYTGRLRVGASASGTNLTGRGDLLSLRALAAENDGQQSLAAAWSAPVHASGTRAGIGLSALQYKLGDPYKALQAHGSASYLSAQLDQPLARSFGYTLDAHAVLSHKALRDRIDAFSTRDDRHLDTLQLALSGEARDDAGGGVGTGGRTFWNLALVTGRVAFDDAQAERADAVQLRTAGAFNRFNLEIGRQRLITPRFSLTVRGLAQWADSNLDASERVTFNGANALRPFGALPTSADEAVQVAIDARYVPEQNTLPGLALVGFADIGRGRANREPLAGSGAARFNSLLAGVGAELPLPRGFSLRVAATREHVGVRTAGDAGWATRGWFELVKSF